MSERIAFDIETFDPNLFEMGSGVYRKDGHVLGCSIATEDGFSEYYNLGHRGITEDEHNKSIGAITEWLSKPGLKIGGNPLYDMDWLTNSLGIPIVGKIVDIQGVEALLDEYRDSYSNEALTVKHLGEHKKNDTTVQWCKAHGREGDPRRWLFEMPYEVVKPYAVGDVVDPLRIFRKQETQLTEDELGPVFDLECDLLPLISIMRRNGIGIDRPRRKEIAGLIHVALDAETAAFDKEYGSLNVKSAKQLKDLFDRRGWEYKLTEKGNASFNKEALEEMDNPFSAAVLSIREKQTMLNNFLEGAWVEYDTGGRIHCDFLPLRKDTGGTVTGRFSSQHPNLQQCLSNDTEILTESGWIRADAIADYRGQVAQYHEDGTISLTADWTPVYNAESTFVKIQTQTQIEMKITKDHRCLTRNRKTGKLTKDPAYIYPKDAHQLQAGTGVMGDTNYDIHMTVFIAALQADGYVASNAYIFSFKKERKVLRLRWALQGLGWDYTEHPQADGHVQFRVGWTLNADIETYKHWKHFTVKKILDLSPATRERLSEEVYLWDGLSTRKSAYTTSEQWNADAIQLLWALTRKRAYQYTNQWGIYVDSSRKDYSLTSNREVIELPEKEPSYCVTVPTGNIVIRYNRKIHITGNCSADKYDPETRQHEFTNMLREVFIPEEDHWYGCIDYSQIEYRFIAHYARGVGAVDIQKRYQDNPDTDYHQAVMDLMHITDRTTAKRLNFGIAYFMGAKSMARKFHWPLDTALAYYNAYIQMVPFIDTTRYAVVNRAKEVGQIRTIYGRLARMSDYIRSQGKEYVAFNRLIQGSAADLNKLAMVNAYKAGIFDVLIPHITVHDELGVSVPKTIEGIEAYEELKNIMEHSLELRVPIKASAEYGPNWGQTKKCHTKGTIDTTFSEMRKEIA